jgi:hypothetical protein
VGLVDLGVDEGDPPVAKAVLRVANPLAVHPELVTMLGWVVADLNVHFPSFERDCFSTATIANNRLRQDISATSSIEGGTRQPRPVLIKEVKYEVLQGLAQLRRTPYRRSSQNFG